MPALFAPALDLTALCAVLGALALVVLAHSIAQSIAGVLNFSVLGIHPLSNVSRALENSVIAWLEAAAASLQAVARDLWSALTWMWREFLDGVNAMTTHTEDALRLLYGTSVPTLIQIAVRPFNRAIQNLQDYDDVLATRIGRDVARLDAKIETTATATVRTVERDITQAVARETQSIEAQLHAIRSSIDQAIEHALNLARVESQTAVGELRQAEDAALGALRAAEGATSDELHNLIRDLNPAQAASIIAAVPLLAALVNTIAAESGLDSASCRSKVKGICGTDAADWSWLLAGAGALGFGLSLREIIDAGNEVVTFVVGAEEHFAELV